MMGCGEFMAFKKLLLESSVSHARPGNPKHIRSRKTHSGQRPFEKVSQGLSRLAKNGGK
jgi:hypothetical protein